MTRKRNTSVALTIEAFERATNAGQALTVTAHHDTVQLAFTGEVIAMSPCGTMCEIDFGGDFIVAPVITCVIVSAR